MMFAVILAFFVGVVSLGYFSPLPRPVVFGSMLVLCVGALYWVCLRGRAYLHNRVQQQRAQPSDGAVPECNVDAMNQPKLGRRLLRRVCWLLMVLASFLLGVHHAAVVVHQHMAERDFRSRMVSTTVQVVDISQAVGDRVRVVVVPKPRMVGFPSRWLLMLSPAHQRRNAATTSFTTDQMSTVTASSPQSAAAVLNHARVGDMLRVNALVSPPRGIAAKGVFSQQRWLLGMRVGAVAHAHAVDLVGSGGLTLSTQDVPRYPHSTVEKLQFKLGNTRLALRQHMQSFDLGGINNADRGVLLALLTGDRALIPQDIKRRYQHLGISHLLAISGPHVLFAALMMAFLWVRLLNAFPRVFRVLPRVYWVYPLVCGIALAYALLAGWDVPAQRTVVMLFVGAMLLVSRRQYGMHWVMLLSAVVIVAWDPLAVLSAAFWLSFVAVGLLVLIAQSSTAKPLQLQRDPVQQGSSSSPHNVSKVRMLSKQVRHFFYLQIVFFFAILPVSVLFFGSVSVLAPVINMIAIPVLGLVIVPLNIIALGVSWVSPMLADVIWGALLYVLHGFHALLYMMQHVFPNALVSLSFDKTMLWASVVLLGVWLLPVMHALRVLSVPLLMLMGLPKQLPAPVVMTAIDGTGFTAVLLQVKQPSVWQPQKTLLYVSDLTHKNASDYALHAVLLPALSALGVSSVDMLIMSESHTSRVSDAFREGLYNKLAPAQVYSNRVVGVRYHADGSTDKYNNSDSLAKKRAVLPCGDDVAWQWGDVQLRLLSPWQNVPVKGNDAACVLKVKVTTDHGKTAVSSLSDIDSPSAQGSLRSALIMGNASQLTERMLLKLCVDITADVLLLSQQGRQTASLAPFLAAVTPQRVLVSTRFSPMQRLPDLATRERLERYVAPQSVDVVSQRGSVRYWLGSDIPTIAAVESQRKLSKYRGDVMFYRDSLPWLGVQR